MPFTIAKSRLPEGFIDAVEAHRQALMEHRFTVGVPAPCADPRIEASIKRVNKGDGKPDEFVADYVIIDDTPPPEVLLEQRKQKLWAEIHAAERQAVEAIYPTAKRRQIERRLNEVIARDIAIRNKIVSERILPWLPKDFDARVVAQRTADDQECLRQAGEREARLARINRWASDAEADVADLTAETIDSWRMPPLPSAE